MGSTAPMSLDGLRLEADERIIFVNKAGWEFWLFWGIMALTVVMIPLLIWALKSRGKAVVLTNRRIIRYNGGSNPSMTFADLGEVVSKKGIFAAGMFNRLILKPKEGSTGTKLKLTYLGRMNSAPAVHGAIVFWKGFPGVEVERAPGLNQEGALMMPGDAVAVAIAPRVNFTMGEVLTEGKGVVAITPNVIVAIEGKFEKSGVNRMQWGLEYPVGAWVMALAGVSTDVADFQARIKRFIEETKVRAEVIPKEKVKKVHSGMGQLQITSGKRIPFNLGMAKEVRERLAAYAYENGYPKK